MGVTGQAIVRAIVAGERDPAVLAKHHTKRLKASWEEVQRALTGNWREEHLFVLQQALAVFDALGQRVIECDRKIEVLLAPLQQHAVSLRSVPKTRVKHALTFDARQALANWPGVDLTRINGLGVSAAMKLLAEIGPDLGRFATVKHFCSWLCLCPGTKVSGGKVLAVGTRRSANRARQVLT